MKNKSESKETELAQQAINLMAKEAKEEGDKKRDKKRDKNIQAYAERFKD